MSREEQVDHVGIATADATVAGERHDDEDDSAEPDVEPGEREPWERERAGAELERHDRDRQPEPSGINVNDTSPNRKSWNSCGIAPLSNKRRRRRCVRCRAAGRSRRSPRARASALPRYSRPIRLWSVEVNHAATDAGNDPIADSPRAAPTASGLDSIVVMYVGLACRACRGETSNGHGGPTRPDTTRPPASGRKSRNRRDPARRASVSRHAVPHQHVEGHRAEQDGHVRDRVGEHPHARLRRR